MKMSLLDSKNENKFILMKSFNLKTNQEMVSWKEWMNSGMC